MVAMPRLPFAALRSMRPGALIPALHRADQPTERAPGRLLVLDRADNDVAQVPATRRSEHRKADERREGGAAMRIGQARDLPGPADADRPTEHALHVVGDVDR